jgi:DNA-binding NarL/FixJ family response regulator
VLAAAGSLPEAADEWLSLGCAYEAGLVLSESGHEEDLIRALELFDGLGAVAAAAVIRRRMRSEGVRSIPRGRRPSTRANAHGLTAREQEVVELLESGATNAEISDRLFISTRTVENHVRSILAKFGVRNRHEVVAQVAAVSAQNR